MPSQHPAATSEEYAELKQIAELARELLEQIAQGGSRPFFAACFELDEALAKWEQR